MTRAKRLRSKILLFCLLAMPSLAFGDLKELDTDTSLRAVYFVPDAGTNLVTVAMVVVAGEVDVVGPEGLSHYLEHLMFWHADNVNGQAIHARDGNAWVNGIVSSYYNRAELSELEDMVEFSARLLTPPELARAFMLRERNVVNREYDLRVLENPDERVLTDMRRQLYDNHPISRSVIGTPESINSLTIQQAMGFHKEYYHSANAILIISGDLDEQTVKKLVNSRFARPVTGDALPHRQEWRQNKISAQIDVVNTYVEPQAKSTRVLYSSLSDWVNENDDEQQGAYTIEFARRLLESALPGSLAKPLRLDEFIVSGYELNMFKLLSDQVELLIFAWPDDGITLEVASESLSAALSQIGENGVTRKSFDRIKKRWLQTATREDANARAILFRAWHQISYGLEPNTHADHLQRIESVSLTDLNSLFSSLGQPQRKVVGLVKGE